MNRLLLAPLLFALAACSGGGPSASAPVTAAPRAPSARAFALPVARANESTHHIGVGVWVNPGLTDSGPTSVDALQSQIGYTFDYALHYANLTDPFPDSDERDDITYGRIPLVGIRCVTPLTLITNGSMDAAIDALAKEMAAYTRPIELRYCWEMNVTYSNGSVANYIASWKYIHDRFAADGTTNVRWFFCPGASGNFVNTGMAYYPGDDYVDDVGFDVYDRTGVGLQGTLDPPYAIYAATTKPIIVGETGESPGAQASYLDAAAASLIATRYPKIAAIGYFDAQGPMADWTLKSDGIGALAEFVKTSR